MTATVEPLESLVRQARLSRDLVRERTERIHQGMLSKPHLLDGPNFRRVGGDALEHLFDAYDREFFAGHLRPALNGAPLQFRFSKRLTKSAGHTAWAARPGSKTVSYEIAISAVLFAHGFEEGDPPVYSCGILCPDRLAAVQRTFEHELIHLTEVLLWHRSSCKAQRFQRLASNLFGHIEHTHALVTPGEQAYRERGVRVGSRVRFEFEGVTYRGIVNRITRRATVLVEDPSGVRYSDGKSYLKFYIPVSMLSLLDAARGARLDDGRADA